MQRWMDPTEDNPSGYMYDDGQPEPTYGTQADVEAALAAVRQQEAAQPAPTPAASVDNSYYSAGGYTPAEEAYLQSLRDARAALAAKYPGAELVDPSFLNPVYSYAPYQGDQGSYDPTITYAPGSEIDAAMASGVSPESQITNRGYNIRNYGQGLTNQGAYLTPGTKYWLVDNVTGKPLGSGSTPAELQALSAQANGLSASQGAKANWSVVTDDGSGNYKTVASDFLDPEKKSGLGWLDFLLPAVGAILAPFTGGLSLGLTGLAGTAVGAGIGSALGSGLSSAIQGRPLDQALMRAALSGVTSGIGSYVTPGISNALFSGVGGQATAQEAADAISNGLSSALTSSELAAGQALIASGNFVANAGVDAGTSALTSGLESIVVPGTASGISSGVGSAIGSGIGSAIGSGIGSVVDPTTGQPKSVENVTVTGEKPKTLQEILDAVSPSAGSPLAPITESVNVTGYKTPTQAQIDAGNAEALAAVTAANTAADAAAPTPADPAKPAKSTVDKIVDYLSLAGTAASLLGGLGGSGSGTGTAGTGTVPGGAGTMPANFATDTLPTGTDIPAYGGGTSPADRTARTGADLGDIDWNRYGFGPERSFFANVPKRAATGGSMAVTRPSKSFAVQGAGDGRSDDIPAVLSDGEYVMDAETVALLGNGSNKAGAAQLDRFRANVRKHKGKELAKGRFSVNAKAPQAYMVGGRL